MPDSGNNFFKDGYKPTFLDKEVDFTDQEKDNCRLEDGDVSVECLHDYKVTDVDMDVLTETKDLVETLVMDIKKLGKKVSKDAEVCVCGILNLKQRFFLIKKLQTDRTCTLKYCWARQSVEPTLQIYKMHNFAICR